MRPSRREVKYELFIPSKMVIIKVNVLIISMVSVVSVTVVYKGVIYLLFPIVFAIVLKYNCAVISKNPMYFWKFIFCIIVFY